MRLSQPSTFCGFPGLDVPVPILDDTDSDSGMAPVSRSCSVPRVPEVRSIPRSGSVPCGPEAAPILPILQSTGCIHRISACTLADAMQGRYEGLFSSLHVIDCRYDYEFEGGHIENAVNFVDPRQFVTEFFDNPIPDALLVFHCEFSHNRGPQMAMHFRNYDRDANRARYPAMHYPQIYVLEGGYRAFYRAYPELCTGGYVTMLDDGHRANGDLSRATTRYREAFETFNSSPRKPLSRVTRNSLRSPKQSALLDESPTRRAMHRRSPLRRLNFECI